MFPHQKVADGGQESVPVVRVLIWSVLGIRISIFCLFRPAVFDGGRYGTGPDLARLGQTGPY